MASISAGIGEIIFGRSGDTLVSRGLGSCLAIAIYSPHLKCAFLSHIMLPEPARPDAYDLLALKGTMKKSLDIVLDNKEQAQGPAMIGRCKFADGAIPLMIEGMGYVAEKTNKISGVLRSKYAGGATMFEAVRHTLHIGEKNADMAALLMKKYRIRILSSDVGGNLGRTITFDIDTGIMHVRYVRGSAKDI